MLEIGSIVRVESPSIKNQFGGATTINKIIKVKIIDLWYHEDKKYWCYKGEMVNKSDVKLAKELGKANITFAEHERIYYQPWFKKTEEEWNDYELKEVYKTIVFDELDICEDKTRKKARTFEERRQDAIKQYNNLIGD